MRVGTGVLDGPFHKPTNYGRGDHWSSVLFRLCLALQANTVRPYGLMWVTIMLVGGDVLDAPKNKRLMLLYGGEKAKNDHWRGVEDVAPYKS